MHKTNSIKLFVNRTSFLNSCHAFTHRLFLPNPKENKNNQSSYLPYFYPFPVTPAKSSLT